VSWGRIRIKDMKLGDEITYNYDKSYFDRFIRPIGCRCLSGRIGHYNSSRHQAFDDECSWT
jgi:hypothetical protein